MKSYNETINTVFDRIDEYKTAQKRKKQIITRITVSAFSVCLAVAIGVFAFKGDIFKSEPPVTLDDSTVMGEKDYTEPSMQQNTDSNAEQTQSDEIDGDWHGDGQETPPDNVSGNSSTTGEQVSDPAKLVCVINQIESIKDSDTAPPHPINEHYHKDWGNSEAIEYLGIDFSFVNEKYNLDSSNCGAWYKNGDNTVVMDYNVFAYSNDKVNFTIEASKISPPGSCIVVTTEEVVSTIIGTRNGPVYVKFYGTQGTVMSQNYSDNQTTIIAEFQHKGVYFYVKANDISAFNFYQIVSAIANG